MRRPSIARKCQADRGLRPTRGLGMASKIKNLILIIGLSLTILLPSVGQAYQSQDDRAKSLASYTMGVVHDMYGDTDKAIEEFKRSLEHRENYAAHLRLGADYARLGKLPRAIEELQLVLKHDINNVQARYLLALIYSSQREFDKAAQEYESILTSFSRAEPENLEIYGYLAQLYYSQKEYDKAISQFETILTIDKQNVDVMFLLGCLYLETAEREKAIDLYRRAILLNPEHDTSLNSLGYLYAEEGEKLDEAQDLVERAIEIDPDNGAYFDSLGWVYFKKGQYADAVKFLKQADSLLQDPVIYEHLGDVYFMMEKKDEAKKYWTLSLELLPEQDQVLKKLEMIEQ